MYVPVWAAVIAGAFTMIGTIVVGYFVLRGKNAETAVKKVEVKVTEDGQLRDDQRELIQTLKTGFETNQVSFQDLIAKYAAAVISQAETQAKLTAIQTEVAKLREEFAQMRADRDKLQEDRDTLLSKSACVPLLEDQVKDLTRQLRQAGQTIKSQGAALAELTEKLDTATVLASVASRAQERVEGGLVQANKDIRQMASTSANSSSANSSLLETDDEPLTLE